MRKLLLAFGSVGAAVTVGLVARHGYLSADTPQDGTALAMLLAIIAIGGLVGHAVAVHLWPISKIAGAAVFVLATMALLLNLSTSFEAIIGRAATGEAERAKHIKDRKDAEAELSDVNAELAQFRNHSPETADAVAAARDRANTATEQRKAECDKRGTRCRDREADERKAQEALTTAERQHAITQRRTDLEAQAAKLRAKIDNIPATAHSNTMAAGLARLFRLPETEALSAATWHKLAIAALVELLIAAAFAAAELAGRRVPSADPSRLPDAEVDPQPVIAFLKESVAVKRGSRVSLPDLYVAYRESRYPPLAAAEFGAVMKEICEQVRWPVIGDGKLVYLADRKLKSPLKLITQ